MADYNFKVLRAERVSVTEEYYQVEMSMSHPRTGVIFDEMFDVKVNDGMISIVNKALVLSLLPTQLRPNFMAAFNSKMMDYRKVNPLLKGEIL